MSYIHNHRHESIKSQAHSISNDYLNTTGTKLKQEKENIPLSFEIQLAMVNF
jgi:hypothetical protein